MYLCPTSAHRLKLTQISSDVVDGTKASVRCAVHMKGDGEAPAPAKLPAARIRNRGVSTRKPSTDRTAPSPAPDVPITELPAAAEDALTDMCAESRLVSVGSERGPLKGGVSERAGSIDGAELPYVCPLSSCRRRYMSNQGLRYHLANHHTAEEMPKEVCGW